MISQEDKDYIEYIHARRKSYIKPDVKRIVRIYNTVMPDGKHRFFPLKDTICACNLRPYLKLLYQKLKKLKDVKTEDAPAIEDVKEDVKTIVEDRPKPRKKKKVSKTKN